MPVLMVALWSTHVTRNDVLQASKPLTAGFEKFTIVEGQMIRDSHMILCNILYVAHQP